MWASSTLHDVGRFKRQCVVLGPKVPRVIVSFVGHLRNSVEFECRQRDMSNKTPEMYITCITCSFEC